MKKLLTALLFCAAASSPAWAQSSRYYGAVDIGTVSYSGPGFYSSPSALSLSAGYRHLPNLDFEAGLTLVGRSIADLPGVGRVDLSENILSAVAIGKIPLNSQVNLFGKLGLGLHEGSINGLTDDLIYGFGAQVMLNKDLNLRVQYESLGRVQLPGRADTADMSRLAVGLAFNF